MGFLIGELQARIMHTGTTVFGRFDARYLGFATIVPVFEAFRRISFALPTALAHTASSPLCIASLVIGALVACGILLAWGRTAQVSTLARGAVCTGALSLLAMGGVLGGLANAWLASAAYVCIGAALVAYAAAWTKAYVGASPLGTFVYVVASVFVGNLLQPLLIAITDPWVMLVLFAGCLGAGSALLFSLGQNVRIAPCHEEKPDSSGLLRLALSTSSWGFILCFFSWGVMAIPPVSYASDHSALVFFVGNLAALAAIGVFCFSLRSTARYEAIRQKAFFLLPVFAIFLAYFSFIRMLDTGGMLKHLLSIGYNASVSGLCALFVGLAAAKEREKGADTTLLVAVVLVGCALLYALAVGVYAVLGNNAMYIQIVLTTVYALSLSIISTRKASLNDEDLVGQRCAILAERHGLSARESEVLELLAASYSSERIAEQLSISIETVRTHRKRIYAKLGVHRSEELVRAVREAR